MTTPFAAAWSPLLVGLLVWSARWAVLIAAVALWFRVRPPTRAATRHAVCLGTLGAGLLIPLAPAWTVRVGRVIASASLAVPAPSPPPRSLPTLVATDPPPDSAPPRAERPALAARAVLSGWDGLIVGGSLIWLAGMAVRVGRLGAGWWVVGRLRRSAVALSEDAALLARRDEACRALGVRRRVAVGVHPAVGAPVVLGGWRPLVLVPPAWSSWSPEAQRASLLHEVAHLARGDDWVQGAAELVRVPFWFHPGVAWLAGRLVLEAELLADAAAVAGGVAPLTLARLLIDCARQGHRLDARWAAPGRWGIAFGRSSTVLIRVEQLTEGKAMRTLTMSTPIQTARQRATTRAILAGTILITLGSGGLRLRAQDPAPATPPLAQAPTPAPPPAPPTPIPAGFTMPREVPPTTGPIAITVQDSVGVKLGGAIVVVRRQTRGSGRPIVAQGRTATDGSGTVRFNFTVQPHDLVLAYHEGYAYTQTGLGQADQAPLTISLPPQRVMAGTVVDEAGRPVGGALVRAMAAGGRTGPATNGASNISINFEGTNLADALTTRTDARGRFRLAVLPDYPQVDLLVSAPGKATRGYTGSSVQVPDSLSASQFERVDLAPLNTVRLKPEARIRGRLVSRVPGVSAAGRTVVIEQYLASNVRQLNDPSYELPHWGGETEEITTDSVGRFEFGGLVADRARVAARPGLDDHAWIGPPVADIVLKPGQTADVTLEIVAGVELTGTIVDPAGRPLPGISTGVEFPGMARLTQPRFVTTDDAGHYRYRIPAGSLTVYLAMAGRPWTVADTDGQTRWTFAVPGDAPRFAPPPTVLVGTVALVGRLVDATGAPLAGAQFTLWGEHGPPDHLFSQGWQPQREPYRTDAQGQFRAEELHTSTPMIPSGGPIVPSSGRLPADRPVVLRGTRPDGRAFTVRATPSRDGSAVVIAVP